MDYKTVLNVANTGYQDYTGDTNYKTYEECLQDFVPLRVELPPAQPQLPSSVQEALCNTHDSLCSYWSQFGILDRSKQPNFFRWANENFNFKEHRLPNQPKHHLSDQASNE